MKKFKIITVLAILLSVCTSFASCVYFGERKMITEDKAIEIAAEHFGINAADCAVVRTELDDGKYEIEFIYENREYDIEVDAYSEKVREIDIDHTEKNVTSDADTIADSTVDTAFDSAVDTAYDSTASADSRSEEKITKERAMELVCEHFGVNIDDCSFVRVDSDYGEYEIEFVYEGREYEADVNAFTGKVTETDIDRQG